MHAIRRRLSRLSDAELTELARQKVGALGLDLRAEDLGADGWRVWSARRAAADPTPQCSRGIERLGRRGGGFFLVFAEAPTLREALLQVIKATGARRRLWLRIRSLSP